MEFKLIKADDFLWDLVMEYAKNCSWKAGPFLAEQMNQNAFSDWERIVVALDNSDIAGYCTISKTDCIPDVSYTPYIGFMFVGEKYRGNRLSEQLIKFAITYAKDIGFTQIFIVSGEKGLYEKYGFVKVDDKVDFWGNCEQIFCMDI